MVKTPSRYFKDRHQLIFDVVTNWQTLWNANTRHLTGLLWIEIWSPFINNLHTERCRSYISYKYISFTNYQSLCISYNICTFMIRSNRNLFREIWTMDYFGPDFSLLWFWSVNPFEPTILTRSFNALLGYPEFAPLCSSSMNS